MTEAEFPQEAQSIIAWERKCKHEARQLNGTIQAELGYLKRELAEARAELRQIDEFLGNWEGTSILKRVEGMALELQATINKLRDAEYDLAKALTAPR